MEEKKNDDVWLLSPLIFLDEPTRVRLLPLIKPDSQERSILHGSDYINANHINGGLFGEGLHSYIATQAPTGSTTGDFWRMIWEQESPLVLMLANEIEEEEVC